MLTAQLVGRLGADPQQKKTRQLDINRSFG